MGGGGCLYDSVNIVYNISFTTFINVLKIYAE